VLLTIKKVKISNVLKLINLYSSYVRTLSNVITLSFIFLRSNLPLRSFLLLAAAKYMSN
jgi:hypothetical protein